MIDGVVVPNIGEDEELIYIRRLDLSQD